MLVIVENGNIALCFQLFLNFKAAGCRNIFQIHAAERTGNQIHRIHEFVHVLRFHAQRECVHAAQFLEQHAFAFHHGHTGLRTDVAQTQHSAAVRYHQTQVGPTGQLIGFIRILLNFQTRRCHTGGVSQRQILRCFHRNPGNHFDFALSLVMHCQTFFSDRHKNILLGLD